MLAIGTSGKCEVLVTNSESLRKQRSWKKTVRPGDEKEGNDTNERNALK